MDIFHRRLYINYDENRDTFVNLTKILENINHVFKGICVNDFFLLCKS